MTRGALTALCACALAAAAAANPLDARLTFSQDGGKTWSPDFPSVVSGAVVRVRATYAIADSWEKRDVICAGIVCSRPFASHTKRWQNGAYMQRHPVYWKTSYVNGHYEWALDTGGLPVGAQVFLLEIGYAQKTEKGANRAHISDNQPFYLDILPPVLR